MGTVGNVALLQKLLCNKIVEFTFEVNGFNFGRGGHHIDCDDSSNCVRLLCWKINHKGLLPLAASEIGTFLSQDAYIVKANPCTKYNLPQGINYEDWFFRSIVQHFRVITDFGDVLFYWKGINAVKGGSPLPPEVAYDQPVHRINQWSEPPMFLRLFSGPILVYSKQTEATDTTPCLFIMLGETYEEVRLYEVPCQKKHLRSKACLFLIDVLNNQIIVWFGCKIPVSIKSLARKVTKALLKNTLFNFANQKVSLKELEEGNETGEFTHAVVGDYDEYYSYREISFAAVSPRLFYFHRITGNLDVIEIENIYKMAEFVTEFPFLRSHLHTVPNPALFLLDASYKVWVWCNCSVDDVSEEISEQYASDLAAVKQISEEYSKERKYQFNIEIVVSGNEPKEFTNLFPYW